MIPPIMWADPLSIRNFLSTFFNYLQLFVLKTDEWKTILLPLPLKQPNNSRTPWWIKFLPAHHYHHDMRQLMEKLTFLRFVFKNLSVLPRSEVSEIRTVFLCRHEEKE